MGFRGCLFLIFDAHQIPILDRGGAETAVEGHAAHRAIQESDANVEDALRTAGWSPDLERDEPHVGLLLGPGGGRQEVGDEDGDAADDDVAKPRGLVDLDGERGGLIVEEVVVDAEHELLVPRWGAVAGLVDPGS